MRLPLFNKRVNKVTGALIAAGLMISPMGMAIASNVDIGVTPQSEGQHWSTYQINVENADTDGVEVDKSTLEFVLDTAASSINWSSTALAYPAWSLVHTPTSDGKVLHTLTFDFPQQDWANSVLSQGDDFVITVSFGGMIADLDAFEQSVEFNGEGGEIPPSGDVSLLSPRDGDRLELGLQTNIVANVEGDDAHQIEFWAFNQKVGIQQVQEDQAEYDMAWTPSQLGSGSIEVILFNEAGTRIKADNASVEIYNDSNEFQPPEVEFLSPEEGGAFKQSDTVNIQLNATDADDDLATIQVTANNQEVCVIDATTTSDFSCDWNPDVTGSVELKAVATDEQSLTGNAKVNITVTKDSGNQCGDVPLYQDGTPYQVGDQVTNVGFIYTCKVFGWCGDPVWAPGTGHPNYPDAWKDAWDVDGECDPTPIPQVDLVSPGNGDRFRPGETIPVIVNAADDEAKVTRVDVELNGELAGSSTDPINGDEYHIVLPAQSEGVYNLTAVAHNDQEGSSETAPITLAVTDLDIVVSLTAPTNGSTFYQGRSIRLAAEAKSFEGNVTKVQFLLNGDVLEELTQAPFEYQWNGAQVGEHVITAIAYNSEGQKQTSAPAQIEVKESASGPELGDNPDRSITYLTSWGLSDIEELQNSKGDGYFLSFGKWDASGQVTVSDQMISAEYNSSWIEPSYQSWTQLKHEQPHKAMMVAMGGAAYDSMWTHMGTEAQREAIVDELVSILNTPYPVYKKGLKPEELAGECLAYDWQGDCDYNAYQLAGYATIDGIDFDFERTVRISEQDNRNLEALVALLRERIGNSKLLSLTTYHVGADPVECANPSVYEDCSFVEPSRSAHHGEVISLLQNTRDTFDFFNVMAYDAGQNFKYEVAMANYAQHIGDKTKVVLGNTINSQWGPDGRFVETRENNIKRTEWQKLSGYGGFFIWTLGSNTESLTTKEQVEYFNELIDNN
ncbi:Ig-like domain-containing protein [Photobacterium makurazakiensis]|uniref:Ig-like domain-containing protein n=1 Tax=Photobacterium makurazakiensis TaxID=2910234 RepID=UPI003D0BE725